MRALLILLCLVGIGAGAYYYISRNFGAIIFPTNHAAPTSPQGSAAQNPGAGAGPAGRPPAAAGNPSFAPAPVASVTTSEIDAARVVVAQKSYMLDQAKAAVLAKLQDQPDYRSAQSDVADLQSQVEAARASNSPDLSYLSRKWIAAKNKVADMESDAYDTPEIQDDQRQLIAAKAHLSDLEEKAKPARKSTAVPTH